MAQCEAFYEVRDKVIRGLRNNRTSIMQMEPERPIPPEDDTLTDQERLDEAMIESFPASDPPSWNAGLSHEQAHVAGDALAARFPWARNWNEEQAEAEVPPVDG